MSQEIKDLLQKQGEAFAEYKAALDVKIENLRKENGTGEINAKLEKIIADYDAMKAKTDGLDADIKAARVNGSAEQVDVQAKAHKEAFMAYCRKNDSSKFANLVQVGVDADGGYACPPEISTRVSTIAAIANPIRQIATVEQTNRAAWQMLNDQTDMVATRIGETGTRAETGTPVIGQVEIVPREMYVYPHTTQAALDDATWNFETWLSNKAGRAFSNLEVTEFCAGNGVLGARGITDYPTVLDANWTWGNIGHVLSGTTSAISATGADIPSVISLLPDEYKRNASFVMHPATLLSYRLLRDAAAGANIFLLWTPSLVAGTPDSLCGYPVHTTTGMPVQASLANIVLFGDIREGYTIVDRIGMNVIRDNITTPGRVKFHCYRRSSAAVTNFQAIKMIRCTV